VSTQTCNEQCVEAKAPLYHIMRLLQIETDRAPSRLLVASYSASALQEDRLKFGADYWML